ncbi:MAG: Flagellar basal-body rod protein FlgG [Syntrophus sp. SKADARSKE-3]|nr:Flagellar basal-body rod protein FlgG [Syntrophus sp. SKADARSKE-3]
MIRSLWTAATGMQAQQLDQDVVANNLANVSTIGFKKSRANFQDLMYQAYTTAGALSATGTTLPSGMEIGMGARPSGTQKIFTQGDYTNTSNQFDWAIEGDGFFQIDDGNGNTVYTRAGNFRVNKDGILVNPDGLQLIPSITVDPKTVTFTVLRDGNWTAMDSTGTILATGRLELAQFINPSGLNSLGRNLYGKTDGSGDPIVGYPATDSRGTVTQYYLEQSNVSVIDEMVKMITGQRAYEINSKAIQTADSMLSIINNLKR